MEISFIYLGQRRTTTRTHDLGTWTMPAVPRVGEQVLIPSLDGAYFDELPWDVISVTYDAGDGGVVCYVTRAEEEPSHRLGLAWSETLSEQPYTLPKWLECAVVPRVGDTISVSVMNHAQLEQLEQVRELDLDDLENERVESRLVVAEVRHEADLIDNEVADVSTITLIVAPVPGEGLGA